ncbi:prepilin-type N-terminal cleavage/methylation domain protein [Verrucomicrobiia bacterium DG1235]|nr:prepilin-type N-terminal cleavage/methylation domain protein [Verrucomicrobiae bacterium DG1235]
MSPDIHSFSKQARSAFTIMEMVVVVAIIGILASVSFGVLVKQRAGAKEDKARADLQVIQVGLEAYRARFGDYPKIPTFGTNTGEVNLSGGNAFLLNALNGWRGPSGDSIAVKSMLNNASLSFESHPPPIAAEAENKILDPWDNAYVYDYRPDDSGWETYGYRLYSIGSDGTDGSGDEVIAK